MIDKEKLISRDMLLGAGFAESPAFGCSIFDREEGDFTIGVTLYREGYASLIIRNKETAKFIIHAHYEKAWILDTVCRAVTGRGLRNHV